MDSFISVSTKNSFLRKIFLQMFLGVFITSVIALYLGVNRNLAYGIAHYFTFITIAQLVLVLVLNFSINRISTFMAFSIFILYSGLNGLIFGMIMIAYNFSSILFAFMATLAIFISMILYGLFTKEDLSKYTNFFRGGLIALVIVSLINLFLGVSMLDWLISVFSIVLFTGLIAFDINRIVSIYEYSGATEEDYKKLSVIGALTLYLDFVNLFLNILRLFGNKRN